MFRLWRWCSLRRINNSNGIAPEPIYSEKSWNYKHSGLLTIFGNFAERQRPLRPKIRVHSPIITKSLFSFCDWANEMFQFAPIQTNLRGFSPREIKYQVSIKKIPTKRTFTRPGIIAKLSFDLPSFAQQKLFLFLLFEKLQSLSRNRFPYYYLVTTSSQLQTMSSRESSYATSQKSLNKRIWLVAKPPSLLTQPVSVTWRAVCTKIGFVFTATSSSAITSDSSLMLLSFKKQSEPGYEFKVFVQSCKITYRCFQSM